MKLKINHIYVSTTLIMALLGIKSASAQQEPQYTQYNYNTMTVNPAYTGSKGHLTVTSLFRSQWVGIDGSPTTISLGIDSPYNSSDGIGFSIVQDQIGPSSETFLDLNYAHNIILNRRGHKLALGLKAGARFLSVDWSKGTYRDPDVLFNENINSELLPSVGAGLFYYTDKTYVGLSTPNVLYNKRYDAIEESVGTERMHLYLIAGYVFDLNSTVKFKPSTFVKYVEGAPLIADLSLNFLFNEALTLGVNYRWDDSIGALLGFQINPQFNLGYAYDLTTNNLGTYNSGTHEIFLRYQLISKITRIKSPRFF
ncbi:MAG: type IX secretion system membrane protein PorP/SprF [Maribacter sp.]